MQVRSALFLAFCIMVILIEICYSRGIGVEFAYTGIIIKFSFSRLLVTVIFLISFFFSSCFLIEESILSFINDFLIVFSVIPTCCLWPLDASVNVEAIVYCVVYWTIFESLIILISWYNRKKNRGNGNRNISKNVPYLKIMPFIVLIIISFSFYMAFRYGKGIRLLLFKDTLNVRLALRNITIPAIVRYPYIILGGAILPIMTQYGFSVRRKWIVIMSLISSYLLYSINGMKGWILFQGISIVLAVLLRKSKWCMPRRVSLLIALGGDFLWGLSYFMYRAFANKWLLSYMHRAFTVLAQIHYYNFDFFSKHETLWFRESILRFFWESPYEEKTPLIIGHMYFNSETMNCTNGMITDAIANLGAFGVLVFPLMIVCIVGILANNLDKYRSAFSYTIVFVLMNQLVNTSFFTNLITGGYIFVLIAIWIVENKKLSKNTKRDLRRKSIYENGIIKKNP